MAAGKPVVGSNIESIAEVVINGEDGLLVPSSSPSELADKVNTLLTNEKLSMSLGKRAKDSVRKYDWDAVAKDIMNIYEQVRV